MTLLTGETRREKGPTGGDVLGGLTLAYVKLTTLQERTTREGLVTARDLTNTSHRNRQTMGQKLTRGYWEILERYELGSRQGKAKKGTVM